MTKPKTPSKDSGKKDLRGGLHGSLTVPEAPLAGADPIHVLENPPLATPDVAVPEGQGTHE